MNARQTAVVGTAAVTAYAATAALHLLVLNPLAAVPGRSLSQIRADVAAAGMSMDDWLVVLPAAVALVVAVAELVAVRRRPDVPAHVVAVPYLVLLAAGAPAHFFAGFGPGISLADTYAIGGGAASPWFWPLYAASGLAGAALAAVLVSSARRRRVQAALPV